ncbi:single-stranded DNA-binding protein [Demequina sp.]|uniref:single-stranded DNA-binding protein n=1 Tax=Demequina sp. TaxID=2050685 RepID=UPI0025C2DC86|nr:single-stranded DNA-binding protein [Demequina sp.]
MNDLTMTVAGWVATDPRHVVGPTGTHLTSFRMASTSRYFDRDKNEWVDGQTEWFTVRAFRGASLTVKESIEKGQPVVVQGRFRTNEWESDSGPRTDLIIDAVSVGHDLTRGIAKFTRATGDPTLEDPTTATSALASETDGDGDTRADGAGDAEVDGADHPNDVAAAV